MYLWVNHIPYMTDSGKAFHSYRHWANTIGHSYIIHICSRMYVLSNEIESSKFDVKYLVSLHPF